VDYTDQYALAVIKNATPAERYHIILGDEVQDWSKAQIECVKRHLIPGGIFVLVGDPDQSIYSWRGADPDGMENQQKDTKAEVMRMTVSFRCPHNAINFAKRLVPHIKAAPGAKEGTTIDANSEEVLAILKEKKRGLLISRKNLPLAKWALLLLRNNVPAIIRGRDILGNLLSYVDRFADSPDLTTFIASLKEWTDAELAKLGAMGNKGEAKAEALQDQTGTVVVLCEGLQTVEQLRKRLDTIFDDESKDKVICSTVYRAKGDEHETIIIVSPTDFDKVWGTTETAVKERRNAAFVLITRTLDTIIFCDGRPADFASDGSAMNDDDDNDNAAVDIAEPEPEPTPEPEAAPVKPARKPRKRKAV
jgi:superfamily I DNA/RNA helicase